MNVMRQATLVMLLLVMGTGIAMAGETQIVLQWLDTAAGVTGLREIYKIEIKAICTQHLIGEFRRRISMPSRNRNKKPAVTTLHVVHDDERIEPKSIPADGFPRVLVLPKFSMPELFTGQNANPPEAWVLYHKADLEQVRSHGGKGFTAARFDITMFSRMLAKMRTPLLLLNAGRNTSRASAIYCRISY
jgi:hypothetical protein